MAVKSKKILLITSEFPPLPGGIGNHAYLLSKYLKQSNYEISILTDYRSIMEDDSFDSKLEFKITRIKRNIFTYLNRIIKSFYLVKRNEIIINSGKFSLWIGAILTLFYKSKKFIAVLHGSEIKAGNRYLQYLTRWSLLQYDDLIAVSNFTKDYALTVHPKLKIKVINNGIVIDSIVEERTFNKEINLVTVGNVTYRKGQQNVINALPLLKQYFPMIHYHCVGISTEQNTFEKLARELNVEHDVTFHGKLDDIDKDHILKKATVFIMLSDIIKNDFEGFGIAILEANYLGLPAIGSDNSGITDAIKNNFSGRLVNPHKPEEVLDAVKIILDSYPDFSRNAKEWAKQFDWENVVKEYVKIIDE